MNKYRVRTESGSQYVFEQHENNRIELLGEETFNKAHEESKPIPALRHPVEMRTPWPPVVGESMLFFSLYYLEPLHPLRLPGGGKQTSRVVEVELIP